MSQKTYLPFADLFVIMEVSKNGARKYGKSKQ